MKTSTPAKKVLISEDDEGIVELVQILLEERGYEVLSCVSSEDIFQEIDTFHPDLAILDLWMPRISGEEIAKYIRQKPELKDIPIIILSASRDIGEISERIQATAYLPKPFDIDEFEKLVDQLLS